MKKVLSVILVLVLMLSTVLSVNIFSASKYIDMIVSFQGKRGQIDVVYPCNDNTEDITFLYSEDNTVLYNKNNKLHPYAFNYKDYPYDRGGGTMHSFNLNRNVNTGKLSFSNYGGFLKVYEERDGKINYKS